MRGKGLEARLVSAEDKAFRALVKEVEGECTRRFGKSAGQLCLADSDAEIISTCVILKNGQGIACGLLQDLDGDTAQVRCLYVKPEFDSNPCALKEITGRFGCQALARARLIKPM